MRDGRLYVARIVLDGKRHYSDGIWGRSCPCFYACWPIVAVSAGNPWRTNVCDPDQKNLLQICRRSAENVAAKSFTGIRQTNENRYQTTGKCARSCKKRCRDRHPTLDAGPRFFRICSRKIAAPAALETNKYENRRTGKKQMFINQPPVNFPAPTQAAFSTGMIVTNFKEIPRQHHEPGLVAGRGEERINRRPRQVQMVGNQMYRIDRQDRMISCERAKRKKKLFNRDRLGVWGVVLSDIYVTIILTVV